MAVAIETAPSKTLISKSPGIDILFPRQRENERIVTRFEERQKQGTLFKAKTSEELQTLIPKLKITAGNFYGSLKPDKKFGYFWLQAWKAAEERILGDQDNQAWHETWNKIFPIFRDAAFSKERAWGGPCQTSINAATKAAWNISVCANARVKYDGHNPLYPLPEFYLLGAAEVDFCRVGKNTESLEEGLVIHVPVERKGQVTSACLIFPESHPERVKYRPHDLGGPCISNKPPLIVRPVETVAQEILRMERMQH